MMSSPCVVCGKVVAGGWIFNNSMKFCHDIKCQVVAKVYFDCQIILDLQRKRFQGICIYIGADYYDCKEPAKNGSSYCKKHRDEKGCTKCGRFEK